MTKKTVSVDTRYYKRIINAIKWDIPLSALIFVVLFAQEILLRVFIYEHPFAALSLLFIMLFTAMRTAFIRLLTGLFSPRVNYAIAIVVFAIETLLFCAQYIYYQFFGMPLLVYSIANGAQVAEFAGEAARMIISHLWQTLMLIVPPVLFLVFGRHRFNRLPRLHILTAGLSIIFFYFIMRCSLIVFGSGPVGPYETYFNENNPSHSQEYLGMMTSMRLDMQRTLFGFSPKDQPQVVIVPVGGEDGNDSNYEPNMMDIDFDQLVVDAPNDTLRTMHHYFSAVQPTLKNEYTGLFKGKNLIFITAEGFSQYLINEEMYPTIYRLATEGFHFTNMYTPIWGVSTSDGEYVATTGLLPKSGVWSFSRSADNYLPFALGNQFSALGYDPVIAYHNHSYMYYDRNLSHPNMGYDFRAPGHGLNVTEIWPESDLEMMENSVGDYINSSRPFHVYYMTVSGHLEYNFSGNNMARRHQEEVADLPYSDEVRAYLACNLELEQMLAYLVNALDEAGKLDDTVIVLSADHYPYGLSNEGLNELAGHELERNFELYRNGLIIWQADLVHQLIDEPVCSLDIIPTVSNLFGLKYDSRLLMGRDIFASDSLPLVIFNNRSWITDRASFNSVTGEIIGNVDDEYVASIHELVNARFIYSAQILETDYYRVVLGK